MVDDIQCADRHPVSIPVVRIHLRQLLFPQPGLCILAGTPFFPDHAPFLFNSRISQGDEIRPVVQDQQAAVHHLCALYRCIHNHIHGFIERSIGIEVLSHPHADTFGIMVHRMIRKVLTSIKGHVF